MRVSSTQRSLNEIPLGAALILTPRQAVVMSRIQCPAPESPGMFPGSPGGAKPRTHPIISNWCPHLSLLTWWSPILSNFSVALGLLWFRLWHCSSCAGVGSAPGTVTGIVKAVGMKRDRLLCDCVTFGSERGSWAMTREGDWSLRFSPGFLAEFQLPLGSSFRWERLWTSRRSAGLRVGAKVLALWLPCTIWWL